MVYMVNERAQGLLFSCLTPNQQERYLSGKGIIVTGEKTGGKYLLALHHRLSVYDKRFSYCVHLVSDLKTGEYPPYEDHILAQKIVLETDEQYFLSQAFWSFYPSSPSGRRLHDELA